MNRKEKIDYDFFENERIWPPLISRRHPFVTALHEVLERLPEDGYDSVSEFVSFVVEDPRILAINVPFKRRLPASKEDREVRFDTIVVFQKAFSFSHEALVGLLAHELAHSLVSKLDYKTDEKAADDLIVQWGFSKELQSLEAEREIPDSKIFT